MAKIIKYTVCSRVNVGTMENPRFEETFTQMAMSWSEANEEIAKREAYNGQYTIEDDGRVKSPAKQIAELKKQLSATDYKVIKCAECQLLGQEMPYDVEVLHAERQAIRDQINKLEGEK